MSLNTKIIADCANPTISDYLRGKLKLFEQGINIFAGKDALTVISELVKIKSGINLMKLFGNIETNVQGVDLAVLVSDTKPDIQTLTRLGDIKATSLISIYSCLANLKEDNKKAAVTNLSRDFSRLGFKHPQKSGYLGKEIIEAAAGNQIYKLQHYIAQGADINSINNNGITPLMCAAEKGFTEAVLELLAVPGLDINARDRHGETALMKACRNGYSDVVCELLKLKEKIEVNAQDAKKNTALIYAAKAGFLKIVKELLSHKDIKVNLQNNYGERDKVKDTALHKAIILGHPGILEILINRNDIDLTIKNGEGHNILNLACIYGRYDLVKRILELTNFRINEPDNDGDTPLINAAARGLAGIVKMLLQVKGIKINYQNKDKMTAFMYTAKKGLPLTMNELLKYKNNLEINLKNNRGDTALIQAICNLKEHSEFKVIQTMLDLEGIDINAKNEDDYTALIWACYYQHKDVIHKLLQKEEIDVNALNKDKKSALYYAFWKDD
ncbi:MAG: ankyrin repeat domain-containing protein, partial [Candidatus Margulisbacteria bacterium]|nr:ankyrin repeat domain-containing protein [Candidatus Margulisiibacteriota bacterium]